jgi:hypothetical protein
VKKRFQSLRFKCKLQRYSVVDVTVQVNSAPAASGSGDGSSSPRRSSPKTRAAPDAPALLLRLDELDFRDRPLEGGNKGGGATQEKVVTFKGFSVEVAGAGAGASSSAAAETTEEGSANPRKQSGDEECDDDEEEDEEEEEEWCSDSDADGGSNAEGDGWSVPSLPQEREWWGGTS